MCCIRKRVVREFYGKLFIKYTYVQDKWNRKCCQGNCFMPSRPLAPVCTPPSLSLFLYSYVTKTNRIACLTVEVVKSLCVKCHNPKSLCSLCRPHWVKHINCDLFFLLTPSTSNRILAFDYCLCFIYGKFVKRSTHMILIKVQFPRGKLIIFMDAVSNKKKSQLRMRNMLRTRLLILCACAH